MFRSIAIVLFPAVLFGATSVSQYGITFYFSTDRPSGQFANGDYWVQAPVTIDSITPHTINNGDRWFHGWEAGLTSNAYHGFDSRASGFQDSLIPALPYTADDARAVVKMMSKDTSLTSCRPCVRTAAVLSVVDDVPPDSGASVFRPPYFGTDRPYHSVNDLDLTKLPALAHVDATPDTGWETEQFGRVWLDHKSGWSGANLHPEENMPEYGASVANATAEGAQWLMLEWPADVKLAGAVAYTQVGIDMYHMLVNGCTWPPNGGHANGRKLPILMAGYLLGDQGMMDSVSNAPYGTFQEDGHLYFSQKADNGNGRVLFGNPASEWTYWRLLVTYNGFRTAYDPYGYIDGGYQPNSSYQYCCNNNQWKGVALSLYMIPALEEAWNNDDLLTYVERWMSLGAWAQPDPCAPADMGDTTADGSFNGDTLAGSHYGITYGPDPDNPGDCIRDTDSTDGIGRFPDRHGYGAGDGGYGSGFVNDMWDAYRDGAPYVGIGLPGTMDAAMLSGVAFAPLPWNPAAGPLRITVPAPAVGRSSVVLYDAEGAELRRTEGNGGTALVLTSGAHLLPGAYYLAVRSNAGRVVKRVLVIE